MLRFKVVLAAFGILAAGAVPASAGHGSPILISTVAGGSGNGESDMASLSGDGKIVAFQSTATNIVPNDTNGLSDIFVRDVPAGVTKRVSVTSSGAQIDGGRSENPAVSGNGRYVVFDTYFGALMLPFIYRHDLQTGQTIEVSDHGRRPAVSDDGDVVAYLEATATSLDVHVKQISSGAVSIFPCNGPGISDPVPTRRTSISGDGRYVAAACDLGLVAADANGYSDVYLFDRIAGTTTLVSAGTANLEGRWPSVSSNGRYVAYQSAQRPNRSVAMNHSVWVYDRVLGSRTQLLCVYCTEPSISGDGRFVALRSEDNLDPNPGSDIHLFDVQTGQSSWVSTKANHLPYGGWSTTPEIAANGLRIVYFSNGQLAPEDTNSSGDIYRSNRDGCGLACSVA